MPAIESRNLTESRPAGGFFRSSFIFDIPVFLP